MAKAGRHLEGAKTRERVLQTAAELIASQGYSGTSISQISKASQTNPASIYWAFGNKEGLFAAVMERAADRFFAEVLSGGDSGDDIWASLAGLAEAFRGGPEFLRLLLVLSLERRDGDPAVLEAARRVRAEARDSLARGFRDALQLRDNVRGARISQSLARHTLMLFDGVFIASQIEADTTDLNAAFELIAISVRATAEALMATKEPTEKK